MSSRLTAAAAHAVHFATPLAIPLVALAAAACSRASARPTSDEATSAAIPVVTHVATSSARAWSTTSSGIVEARTSVDLAFQVSGKVVMVGPDEGQPVRAGQTIAVIDPTDYRLTVEQAAAQADRSARDRDRNKPLLDAGSIAAADMDRLEAGARQSAAAAELARKKLHDTRLEAPMSGIVARRSIEVGATAAPGQPVFTIVDLATVRVRVGVPEGDVGRIDVGAPAIVRVPALDGTFSGRVSLIGVTADPTTRSYMVEISVANPSLRLRAGMVAEATITSARTVNAIVLPSSAVLHDGGVDGTTLVYVVDRDGSVAHARRVTAGAARGDSLEIVNGVAAGEAVVVGGQQRLRDGARIQRLETLAARTSTQGGTQP